MQEMNDCVIVATVTTTVESPDESGPPAAAVTEALLQPFMSALLLLSWGWLGKGKKSTKVKVFQ